MKIFVQKKITKEELRKLICMFAKQIGVNRVIFGNKGIYIKGTYNTETKNLYIDVKQTKTELLHTFFHELGHHVAVIKNKWKKYHHCLTKEMNTEEVFKIENKIDQIGRRLWHKYVDTDQWGNYKYSYPKALKKDIIKNFISKQ